MPTKIESKLLENRYIEFQFPMKQNGYRKNENVECAVSVWNMEIDYFVSHI